MMKEKWQREHLDKTPVTFYRTPAGVEPVRDWLEENGWPKDVPLCRSLGDGLYDYCAHMSGGRVARIFICRFPGLTVLLHAAIFDLPIGDPENQDAIELARERMKEIDIHQYQRQCLH